MSSCDVCISISQFQARLSLSGGVEARVEAFAGVLVAYAMIDILP